MVVKTGHPPDQAASLSPGRCQLPHLCTSTEDPDLGYTQGMCYAAGVVCLKPGTLEEKIERFEALMRDLRALAAVVG